MSEQSAEIPDLNELESQGSFNADLIAELDWVQEQKRRVELSEEIYNERTKRETAEDKRLFELREGRAVRALGEDYDSLDPADKLEKAKAARIDTISRHDAVREAQRSLDPNFSSGGYDTIEIDLLDKYVQSAAIEWYQQDPVAFLDRFQRDIADAIPEALLDASLPVYEFQLRMLKRYDYQRQAMLAALYKSEGLDATLNRYNHMVQRVYEERLQQRSHQETLVLAADRSAEWGIDNLDLPPIEEDPEFIAVQLAHQRPNELNTLDDSLIREEFVRRVDPNNYQIRNEDPVLLQRRKDELMKSWYEEFGAALQPLMERRYDELSLLYVNEDNRLFIAYSEERESPDHANLGRTIVPVRAIVDPNYEGDWRILHGKTGSGSGNHSPTTIIDVATRLAMGSYTEVNEHGDHGKIFAHRGPNGTIAYESDAGAHRVAAHKLVGKSTIIMNCITPDAAMVQELEQAVI